MQNSWYNNWTTFIIESIFKRNPKVISAVGEIKSVDFFIADCPLDLKVTTFPNKFMELKIKQLLGRSTVSWLKNRCKKIGVTCDASATPTQQLYSLTEKLDEIGRNDVSAELTEARQKVIEESQNDPSELMRWLYENQGEMRFGAENRVYLILADSTDFAQSWKMKRAFSLIEPIIQDYIDTFSYKSLKRVHFEYLKREYTALADALFVVKRT